MKVLGILLGLLLALIQYPLWLGKGGWMRVWELDRQVMLQASNNNRLTERNAGLESEVRDLREGLLAVEERARYELGMVRGWLGGKAVTIYGGSTEIQNNIVAKRMLGLLDHQ